MLITIICYYNAVLVMYFDLIVLYMLHIIAIL